MALVYQGLAAGESLRDHGLMSRDLGLELFVLLVQRLGLMQVLAHHDRLRLRQVFVYPLQLRVQLEAKLVKAQALL